MSLATCSPRRMPASNRCGNDVGQGGIGDHFDMDIRVIRQELSQRRPQDGGGGVLAGVDAQRAGGLVAQLAQIRHGRIDVPEIGCQLPEEAFARLGRGDIARGPGEQAQAEPGLQPANRVTECRLGYAQLRGGAGKAAFVCNHHEGSESLKFSVDTC